MGYAADKASLNEPKILFKGNIKRISLYEQNITQHSIIFVGLSLSETLIRATDLFVLQTVEIRLKYIYYLLF